MPASGRELPPALQWVTRMRLAAGKPLDSERYMPPTGSSTRERYVHEGGRLARVEDDSCVVKVVVDGEDGRVTGIDALAPEGRRAVWRHRGQPHRRRDARPPAPARLRRGSWRQHERRH